MYIVYAYKIFLHLNLPNEFKYKRIEVNELIIIF